MEKSKYYLKGPKANEILSIKFNKAAQELLAEELKTLTPSESAKSAERLKAIAQMCTNTFRQLQSVGFNDEKAFGKTIGLLSQLIGIKDHQLKKRVIMTLVG
jgi:hypothetical protein